MDIQQILLELLTAVLVAAIPVVVKYVLTFINVKIDEVEASNQIKDNTIVKTILEQIETSLIKCINTTSEVFVSELKKNGTFSKEQYDVAFNLTKESFLKVLTEEKKEIIEVTYGNLDEYIRTFVEDYLKK